MCVWRERKPEAEFLNFLGPQPLIPRNWFLKGTVSQDFLLLVFFTNQYPIRKVSNFFENSRSSRLTTGVVDTGGKWKKSLIRKIFKILLGHLWIVELTYIYIFAFKFTLRFLQIDINHIVCHRCQRHRWQICRRCRWYRWQFATGVIDIGGKFATGIVDTDGKFATGINNTSETGGKICRRCRWHRWQTMWSILSCEYLREFSKKFETVLMGYSGAGGKLIREKN